LVGWTRLLQGQMIFRFAPHNLAKEIERSLGSGILAGFPGEAILADEKDLGDGSDRVACMVALGRRLVQFLRGFPIPLNPELTGSLLLKPFGYGDTPNDIDINITMPPSPKGAEG